MTDTLDHTVLIVDDEEQIGKSLGRVLRTIGIKYVYMRSGEEGLKAIKSNQKPFSLILSDQRMPGMKGSEFLEKAKVMTPDSTRFLITGFADVEAVTNAVNKGSIHRYISKPWDNTDLEETIKLGLEQYEMIVENNRLFKLAKEQNIKLYKLNKKLKENSEHHKSTITKLNKEIEALKKRIDQGEKKKDYIKEVKTLLIEKGMLNKEKLNTQYETLLHELFIQFQDIALKNNFKMPDIIEP